MAACLCVCVCVYIVYCVHAWDFPGGHDNFRKMIDEAEPLGYPVVVKNARGHRGKFIASCHLLCSLDNTYNNLYPTGTSVHPNMKFFNRVLND